jgi:SAM-dependent methyltransferase
MSAARDATHAFWRSQEFRSIRDYTRMAAPAWIQERGQSLFRDATIARIRRLSSKRQPFAHALDLGCGIGDWTLGYLGLASRVTGVDINDSFVAAAKKRAAELGNAGAARFFVSTMEEWDDLDADLVAMGAVANYLEDAPLATLLQRIATDMKTKSGGWLYFRATVPPFGRATYSADIGRYRTQDEYEALFRRSGFRVVDCATSAEVVIDALTARLLGNALAARICPPLARVERLKRAALHQNEFINWQLERDSEG